MVKKYIRFIPVTVFSVLIFYMSHQAQPPHLELGFEWQDKLQHFGAFTLYGLLLLYALPESSRKIIYALLLGFLYGASDEIHQYFIPYRSSEFLDWCADACGVIFAVIVFVMIKKSKRNTPSNEQKV